MDRIADFFGADKGAIDQKIDVGEAKLVDELSNDPKVGKDSGKWLVSIGVAMRSLTPRSSDNMISLMSIGTEDAYEYQKAQSFSEFVLENAIAVSLFFVIVFLIALVSLSSFQQTVTEPASSATIPQIPDNAGQPRPSGATQQHPGRNKGYFGPNRRLVYCFKEIDTDIIPGITINSVSVPALNGALTDERHRSDQGRTE